MTDPLTRLQQAGVLAPLDVHLARGLSALAADEPESVALAIALASRAVRHGHVCADLRQLASAPLLGEDGRPIEDVLLPSPHTWALDLGASSLVSAGDRPTPLVFDLHARLYLTRYFRYQESLVQRLRARVEARPPAPDAAVLRDGLARLLGGGADDAADPDARQRLAALVAVLRRLTVISGGPGTGKTTTVVRILALLVEQALAAGRPPPRIRLLAPTGKAAARLVESISAQLADLPCEDDVRAAIPREAATIHRGLGYRPGSPTRFAHDAANPLPADVVLVDEASMVDLALMAKLFEAAPADARVILLGDMNQLASVEAGAILGDICNRGEARAWSPAFAEEVRELAGSALAPGIEVAAGAAAVADCTVELVHSYRFAAGGGIGAAARAINAGDPAALAEALGDPISAAEAASSSRDIALVAMADDADPARVLAPVVAAALGPYVQARDPQARLDALGAFRLLCAHRHGPFGVERLGQAIERILAQRRGLRPNETFYDGRPILVTTNDYQLDLYNGDVGVIHGGPDGRLRAWFPGPAGLRALSPWRLPAHETVFAMTVHKSQGSEFDKVVLLVPPAVSPILTRELLYTAITRARSQVLVFGDPRVLPRAIARRIDRASGLREALWGHGDHRGG